MRTLFPHVGLLFPCQSQQTMSGSGLWVKLSRAGGAYSVTSRAGLWREESFPQSSLPREALLVDMFMFIVQGGWRAGTHYHPDLASNTLYLKYIERLLLSTWNIRQVRLATFGTFPLATLQQEGTSHLPGLAGTCSEKTSISWRHPCLQSEMCGIKERKGERERKQSFRKDIPDISQKEIRALVYLEYQAGGACTFWDFSIDYIATGILKSSTPKVFKISNCIWTQV